MYSVSIFGDGGTDQPAAPTPAKPGKAAQGLFGAKSGKAASPLPRPERFGRR